MKSKKSKKSILIIGLGKFGRYLALKMQELGNQVMVVDKEEAESQKLATKIDDIFIGGASGFVTRVNVISFFNCGLLNIGTIIPNKINNVVNPQTKNTTKGCNTVEIKIDFFSGISLS